MHEVKNERKTNNNKNIVVLCTYGLYVLSCIVCAYKSYTLTHCTDFDSRKRTNETVHFKVVYIYIYDLREGINEDERRKRHKNTRKTCYFPFIRCHRRPFSFVYLPKCVYIDRLNVCVYVCCSALFFSLLIHYKALFFVCLFYCQSLTK